MSEINELLSLKEAIIDLYLAIKIRSAEEVSADIILMYTVRESRQEVNRKGEREIDEE